MGGIGTWELVLILFIALMVFGSKKIPEIARGLGKGMAEFRRAARDVQREISREIDDVERKITPAPSRPQSPEEIAEAREKEVDQDLPEDARPIWEGGEGVEPAPGPSGGSETETPDDPDPDERTT
jgi:sec-independent protein translocase protein TatA